MRYLTPSEIELMEYIEAEERTHPPTIFIPYIYIKTETMRALLETLEKTREALREFHDWRYVRRPWVSEDERVAAQDAMYERARTLLAGFKEERGG